jgi:hypothetical protein
MNLIRGVLLAGKFRSQHDLNGMSRDDQRNILIVEMAGRTNQPNQPSSREYKGPQENDRCGAPESRVNFSIHHVSAVS